MTRDSDGEKRTQKTVAELLAQHGGQVGGTRRRRRRAAEDDDAPGGRQPDISDTAPQAIIERIRSESASAPGRNGRGEHAAPARNGHVAPAEPQPPQPAQPPPAPQPPQDEAPPQPPPRYQPRSAPPPPPPQAPPPAAPPHGTGAYPAPAPEENGRNPLPPRGAAPAQPSQPLPVPPEAPRGRGPRAVPAPPPPPQPPPQHHGPDGTLSARLDGLGDATSEPGAPEQPGPPVPPPPQAGGYPAPPLRRRPLRGAPPPAAEPNTEQFPAVSDGPAPPEAHAPDAAPNVDEPPAGLSGWRGRRTSRRERDPVAQEDTEVGVMPAVPPGPGGAADAGPPTGHFVPDFDDEDDYGDGPGFGGRARTGVLDDDPLGEGGTAVGYAGEPYDDYEDEPYDEYAADTDDDLDDADADDAEAFPEAAEEPSPARQWLALAGQLALGVVGGAGVWLAFNWLWVQLPAAALVAALVVTVGLVWIVRRVRRAEDLQTTVLALLVGLVVTVSPAALLLVSR